MGRIFSGCAAALSLLFLFVMIPGLESEALGGSRVQAVGLGPAAVPYFAGTAVLVLSLIMFVQARPAEEQAEAVAWRPLGLFLALLLVFMLAMPQVGFLVSAIVFLGATFLLFGARSKVVAIIVAIAVPVALDQLLREVFLIPLPTFPGL